MPESSYRLFIQMPSSQLEEALNEVSSAKPSARIAATAEASCARDAESEDKKF